MKSAGYRFQTVKYPIRIMYLFDHDSLLFKMAHFDFDSLQFNPSTFFSCLIHISLVLLA